MKVKITNKYTRELNNILLGENFPLFEVVVDNEEKMEETLKNLNLDFTKNFDSYINQKNKGIKILDTYISYSTLLKQYKYFDYINQLNKWANDFLSYFPSVCFNYEWVNVPIEKLETNQGDEFEIFFILDNGKEMPWKAPNSLNFKRN